MVLNLGVGPLLRATRYIWLIRLIRSHYQMLLLFKRSQVKKVGNHRFSPPRVVFDKVTIFQVQYFPLRSWNGNIQVKYKYYLLHFLLSTTGSFQLTALHVVNLQNVAKKMQNNLERCRAQIGTRGASDVSASRGPASYNLFLCTRKQFHPCDGTCVQCCNWDCTPPLQWHCRSKYFKTCDVITTEWDPI